MDTRINTATVDHGYSMIAYFVEIVRACSRQDLGDALQGKRLGKSEIVSGMYFGQLRDWADTFGLQLPEGSEEFLLTDTRRLTRSPRFFYTVNNGVHSVLETTGVVTIRRLGDHGCTHQKYSQLSGSGNRVAGGHRMKCETCPLVIDWRLGQEENYGTVRLSELDRLSGI